MHRPSRRLVLTVLVLATLLVMALDVAHGPGASALRSAGATVFGPLERLVSPGAGERDDATTADGVRAGVDAAQSARSSAEAQRLASLLGAPATRGASLVPARVIAVGSQGVSGPERVTLDAGSQDGIAKDLTVVSSDGLVGRVVSVAPWTCDVLLIGSDELTVGVRVGAAGTLASLSGAGATGARPRPAGQLGLTLVQRGSVAAGDPVITLGSVGGRPFQPGIPVGSVVSVDPSRGQLAPSAAVRPSVDVTRLDIVGVLLSAPRSAPRAPATGGAG